MYIFFKYIFYIKYIYTYIYLLLYWAFFIRNIKFRLWFFKSLFLKGKDNICFVEGLAHLTICIHTFKISQRDTLGEFSKSFQPPFILLIKTLTLFGHNMPGLRKWIMIGLRPLCYSHNLFCWIFVFSASPAISDGHMTQFWPIRCKRETPGVFRVLFCFLIKG